MPSSRAVVANQASCPPPSHNFGQEIKIEREKEMYIGWWVKWFRCKYITKSYSFPLRENILATPMDLVLEHAMIWMMLDFIQSVSGLWKHSYHKHQVPRLWFNADYKQIEPAGLWLRSSSFLIKTKGFILRSSGLWQCEATMFQMKILYPAKAPTIKGREACSSESIHTHLQGYTMFKPSLLWKR